MGRFVTVFWYPNLSLLDLCLNFVVQLLQKDELNKLIFSSACSLIMATHNNDTPRKSSKNVGVQSLPHLCLRLRRRLHAVQAAGDV